MQISGVDQTYWLNAISNLSSSTAATTATSSASTEDATDSAAISADATQMSNMPPPPHEMDFENMTDEDLLSYLQQMYDITGTLPGREGTPADLSADELAEIRGILTDMAQNSPVSQFMQTEDTSALSADDFKSLIMMFMMNMMSSTSSGSGSDDLYFSGDMDMVSSLLLTQLSEKLSGDGSDAQNDETQKALAAYLQSSTLDLTQV